METNSRCAVTGAFGYSGKYLAEKLLEQGHSVMTLTNSPNRPNPFGDSIEVHPFNFDSPEKLSESLRGVKVLFNTYWVRFNHKAFGHQDAVENTQVLFNSAKEAGVERIVHISISNPDLDSPLEYFRGKAVLEESLKKLGVSYAILRPTVLFGQEDILVNNIAWALRRLPVFGVFGKGDYKLQPIYVMDLVDLMLEQAQSRENLILNAIGPETFSYKELVQSIASIIGVKRLVVGVPPAFGYMMSQVIGKLTKDVLMTKDEMKGLMSNKLFVETPPTGKTKLTEWAKGCAEDLGRSYASELARRLDRSKPYREA